MEEQTAPKKVESVVATPAKVAAKKKRRNLIFEQDFRDVAPTIVDDYFKPKVKDICYKVFQDILDTIGESIQLMIFKDVKSVRSGKGPVNYTSFARKSSPSVTTGAPSISSDYNYDDFYYDTREEAEAVLAEMRNILADYGDVPVARLYDLSGLTSPRYTDENYGWTNLEYAKVAHVIVNGQTKWTINLPRAKPLR